MEWINTILLLVLIVFFLYEKKRLKTLEEDLAFQNNRLGAQADILASHRDILSSHKHLLDSVKAYLDVPIPERLRGAVKITEGGIELKQQKKIAEEKFRFEREVQERTKTIDWYEKEFSVGLDALLQLLLYVPRTVQESIIGKMPNSVMKKGFKRLSEKMLEHERASLGDESPPKPPES